MKSRRSFPWTTGSSRVLFCHALDNVCIVFQSDDYVYKINMVWCDTCGARCAVPSDAAEDKNS
jgi:hypothetical protein